MSKFVKTPKLTSETEDICPDLLLYKCIAYFLGRKAPGGSANDLETVQKPLSEIYAGPLGDSKIMAKDIPRDVHLLVLTSGIYAVPVNPIDSKIWIKIQNFRGCNAVKGVKQQYDANTEPFLIFESLDMPGAIASPLPAIFTVVAARGGCVPLLDCYAFSCPDSATALTLVEKTKQAFADCRGWSNSLTPPDISILDLQSSCGNDGMWKCKRKTDEESQEIREPINPELYQKPSLNGFFYAPKSGVIRTFDIGLEAEAYPLPPQVCSGPEFLIVTQEQQENVAPQKEIQENVAPQPKVQEYIAPQTQILPPQLPNQLPANINITVNQYGDFDLPGPEQQEMQMSQDQMQNPQFQPDQPTMVDLNNWLAGYQAPPEYAVAAAYPTPYGEIHYPPLVEGYPQIPYHFQ